MTDDVLATLMCAPRSTYPWDVVITKQGGVLLFDKRANSSLDYLTVRAEGLGGAEGREVLQGLRAARGRGVETAGAWSWLAG